MDLCEETKAAPDPRAALEALVLDRFGLHDVWANDPYPPPWPGEWTKYLPRAVAAPLLTTVAVKLEAGGHEPWPLTSERLWCKTTPLAFAPGELYVDCLLVDRLGLPGHAGVLVSERGVEPMTNASGMIHDMNEVRPLSLATEEEYRSYLRFFCWSVTGDRGPFQVIGDEKYLPDELRAAHGGKVGQPTIELNEDRAVAEAMINYDGGWFRGTFEIQSDGIIGMIDDDLIQAPTEDKPAWRMGEHTRFRTDRSS